MFSNSLGIVAIAASFVMNLILMLVMILIGASLLKRSNLFTVNKTITLVVVWIVAVVLAGSASALQVEKVWQEVGADLDGETELIVDEDGFRIISVPESVDQ